MKSVTMGQSEIDLHTDSESLSADVGRHFVLTLAQDPKNLTPDYLYKALSLALRDRLVARQKATQTERLDRQVYYLSLEFLMGRALSNAALSLNLNGEISKLLHELGASFENVFEAEHDAGLGNGGLGRLAACFLDSCASLELPVTGYGIRYEFGMFRQEIEDGQQIESPDHWLRDGNPWEFERAEDAKQITFATNTGNSSGKAETEEVLAVPYDVLIPGHGTQVVNRLRLWKAEATDHLDLGRFNAGSYTEAVAEKNLAEHISMVLYPNDVSENGKILRLKQQYFLVSASLQDVVARWCSTHGEDFSGFARANVFQLNDTHPACAIPELMRILLDDYQMEWRKAWKITSQCMAYTNHTLLPEALERWSISVFGGLLPRLLTIIYEINAQFLQEVSQKWPGDVDRLRRMSIIDEEGERSVRMPYLAIAGSFSINGVAALHTDLLKRELFRDFHELWPEKFNNKTNGVTPRRWITHANPSMSQLINESIGTDWHRDLEQLTNLRPFAENADFRHHWQAIKEHNKVELYRYMKKKVDIDLDPSWMLDVQVKRMHEYKRQLLNILHVIHLYDRIHRGDAKNMQPRVVLIGGKAAPGYDRAKLIIHFINCVSKVINEDPASKDLLKLVFLPNYDVTSMEKICPAAELSEQISTAGKEASGTGNMKFTMNGALTIGTLDGANIEIREQVGPDNFFCFGLNADQVLAAQKSSEVIDHLATSENLRRVLDLIDKDHFSMFSQGLFAPLTQSVRDPYDPWMVAADFESYIVAQQRVNELYGNISEWSKMSILNTAASGWFSSDRTIKEYAKEIWKL